MNYLQLAKEQFYALKKETLDEDRSLVGAGNSEEYEIEGVKFSIEVTGFWEKSIWFEWKAIGENGEELDGGTQ